MWKGYVNRVADIFFVVTCVWVIFNGLWVLSTGYPLPDFITRIKIQEGIEAIIVNYQRSHDNGQ